MTKKQVVEVEKAAPEVKDPSTGEMWFITNNQRCSWQAPPYLLGQVSFTTGSLVHPGNSVEVDKGRFKHEATYSKAFKFMIDTGLLKFSKRPVKLDMRDLQSAETAGPPAELKDGVKKDDPVHKILAKAVTVDVKIKKPA